MSEHPVPYEAPAGFEWVVSASDSLDWSLTAPQIGHRQCRFSEHGIRCENIAEAVLFRRSWTRALPWAYCSEHLYGRWIEDGKVVGWHLRRVDGLTGGRALVASIR